jgi:hypothetical protein
LTEGESDRLPVGLRSNIVLRDVNGELVAVDMDSGEYHTLNPVGSRIIKGIASQESTAEIIDAIVEEFSVTLEIATDDYKGFVADLLERGLLVDKVT